jgi:hypothetical protein
MSDFNDDLSHLFNAAGAAPRPTPRVPEGYVPAAERVFTEPCSKCRGTGNWRPGYPCFACKGRGKKTFKTPAADRANARAARADKLADKIAAFKAEHPDVWAWMDGSTFPPAIEMREKLAKYGDLFDHSIAFARRMIEKRDAARAAAVERKSNNPAIDDAALRACFATASANLKWPKLRLPGNVEFTLCGAAGKYPGAIYAKADGEYLGRIQNGELHRSRACTDAHLALIVEAAKNPQEQAVAYGRLTGSCSCCGRELTDPRSVEMGIGPICAGRFGW